MLRREAAFFVWRFVLRACERCSFSSGWRQFRSDAWNASIVHRGNAAKETAMREFIRFGVAALGLAWLAVAGAALSSGGAFAQTNQQTAPGQVAPSFTQMALTDKQIEGVIAAQKDMEPIIEKLPESTRPDPNAIAQLEAAAKKNGFASYEEYSNVVDNIGLVLGGFDPATKKYVGPEAVIRAQIAQVQADKQMSDDDKKEALAELNDALKTPAPAVENKGNIDLIARYYDKLADALGGDQQ
jgi:hypothetical protein